MQTNSAGLRTQRISSRHITHVTVFLCPRHEPEPDGACKTTGGARFKPRDINPRHQSIDWQAIRLRRRPKPIPK
jgi:hypothetical protein